MKIFKDLLKLIKGGVDTLDHLLESYTCRRKTNKWTTNAFFYILDVAAYNAFVLYRIKHPECLVKHGKNRCRRRLLEQLAAYRIKLLTYSIKKMSYL